MTGRAAVAAAATAALLLVCTVAAATGRLWPLDHAVAEAAARMEGHTWDVALSLVALTASLVGATVWTLVLAGVAVRHAAVRGTVAAAVAALAVTALGELVLKSVVDHPGPGGVRSLFLAVGGRGPTSGGSFPSGHMARAVVLGLATAAVAAPRRRGVAVAAVGAYLAAVAWSRVALREHWASDVLGGLLLGALAAVAVVAVAARPARHRRAAAEGR